MQDRTSAQLEELLLQRIGVSTGLLTMSVARPL